MFRLQFPLIDLSLYGRLLFVSRRLLSIVSLFESPLVFDTLEFSLQVPCTNNITLVRYFIHSKFARLTYFEFVLKMYFWLLLNVISHFVSHNGHKCIDKRLKWMKIACWKNGSLINEDLTSIPYFIRFSKEWNAICINSHDCWSWESLSSKSVWAMATECLNLRLIISLIEINRSIDMDYLTIQYLSMVYLEKVPLSFYC